MTDFYASEENFREALNQYMRLFSEGQIPIIPYLGDRAKTLNLPCYGEFPASAKARWLATAPASTGGTPR